MRVHMQMADRRRVEARSGRPTVWLTYDPSRPAARPYRYRQLRCDGGPVPAGCSTLEQARTVARMHVHQAQQQAQQQGHLGEAAAGRDDDVLSEIPGCHEGVEAAEAADAADADMALPDEL